MTTTVLDLTDLEELVKESAVKMLDGDARKKADVDNPDICWDRSVKCVCLFVCLTTITIYFIHPSGKLKLSSDRTTKNISQ